MTFVGKILVIFIMVFALFFLAVATVVFSTAQNWKKQSDTLQAKIREQSKEVSILKDEISRRQQDLATTTKSHEAQVKALNSRINDLNNEVKLRQDEITKQMATVETSQQTTKSALEEAAHRKSETDLLRGQLSAVQKQANEFQIRQTELQDQIRILQRENETAKARNSDLRERVDLLSSVIRQHGLNDDVRQIKGVKTAPPDVEGEVSRVDSRNRRVEITIGSDDGLVEGHELEVWHTKPTPEYLGRIRIESVEPDKSVGIVIGKTVLGKKIQEGDLVAPKIRPRS